MGRRPQGLCPQCRSEGESPDIVDVFVVDRAGGSYVRNESSPSLTSESRYEQRTKTEKETRILDRVKDTPPTDISSFE